MPILRFDPSASVIIVDAQVTGRVTIVTRLVLDTGASLVVLPWKLALGIGISIDPEKTIQTTTATAIETVPKVVIPEISVLGKKIKNVDAIIKDFPPESPIDGLLGLSFLKHFHLKINFPKGELFLE
ncbi:clan AA aspartic protease [Candidatus Daviesbacteria bacterium]|nr:clan AA aspartic protease [Candidatus Daviesbacteria bacterium]